ncbi:MAG: FAD-dependent oxidoreductase [Pseudomonadota bacterium]
MSVKTKVLIIGAGHAAGALAAQLREQGFQGDITLVGDEPWLPYQRPPLSKAFIKGEPDPQTLYLKNAAWYADQGVVVRTGESAIAIERGAGRVMLASGERLPYDYLVLATGARPRQLAVPGAQLAGILTLRGIDDAARLKAALRPGRRLAIVGGGYIGLEVAASARALGVEVTVIEREERLLARVASASLSQFFEGLHQRNGVQLIRNACLSHFEGSGSVQAALLADGSKVECDAALIGIGAQPRDELARESGLTCENGVVVDHEARSSDPAIFAIGDLSFRPLPTYGDSMFRLESVPNALEQARQVACAITGKSAPTPEVPWFWSDQYDCKLQIAGLPFGATRQVMRGSPEQGKFAVYHLCGERVVAVEAVASPLDFIAGKQFIASAAAVSAERLADSAVKAKDAVLLAA